MASCQLLDLTDHQLNHGLCLCVCVWAAPACVACILASWADRGVTLSALQLHTLSTSTQAANRHAYLYFYPPSGAFRIISFRTAVDMWLQVGLLRKILDVNWEHCAHCKVSIRWGLFTERRSNVVLVLVRHVNKTETRPRRSIKRLKTAVLQFKYTNWWSLSLDNMFLAGQMMCWWLWCMCRRSVQSLIIDESSLHLL